jgi:hypothetical protein
MVKSTRCDAVQDEDWEWTLLVSSDDEEIADVGSVMLRLTPDRRKRGIDAAILYVPQLTRGMRRFLITIHTRCLGESVYGS